MRRFLCWEPDFHVFLGHTPTFFLAELGRIGEDDPLPKVAVRFASVQLPSDEGSHYPQADSFNYQL